MKRFCILLLSLVMLLSFTACGGIIPDPGTTAPSATSNTEEKPTQPSKPAGPLDELREAMDNEMLAVADFGAPELTEDHGIMDHLQDRYPQWLEEYGFISDISEERIILTCDYDSRANLVCIVPKDPEATVRVNVTRYIDVMPYEKWDVVYTGETGEPILLLADATGAVSVSVDITDSQGQETAWHPNLGGTEPYPGDAWFDGLVMDFSPVSDKNAYLNALAAGWTEPDIGFLEYGYWQSDYSYQFEIYYDPGQFYDGDAYLYGYTGTDEYGYDCYEMAWQGKWLYTDGKLLLETNGSYWETLEAELPILTDPDGNGKLRIFRGEEGSALPFFGENMQYDELTPLATDTMSPYEYALSMGWRLPELEELINNDWRSDIGYAIELNEDGVPGDNAGELIFYDVSESGAYTKSYTGTWSYADGMLHLLMIPENGSGQFVDDSFPILMLDGALWIGRNEAGNGLPYFHADTLDDVLMQSMG